MSIEVNNTISSIPSLSKSILERRSIRSGFIDIEIESDIVREILDCGRSAPSSKNAQPWIFHAVTNKGILRAISEDIQCAKDADRFVPVNPVTGEKRGNLKSTTVESAEILGSVALGIFIENSSHFSVSRKTVAQASDSIREDAVIGLSLEYIGLGATIQNMWLAAEARDIRGVFMGDVLISEEFIKRQLSFRGDLVGVLALGYTSGEPSPKKTETENVYYHQ